MEITRRSMLKLGAVGGALTIAPGFVLARAATEKRFVFVIQRGAADGLNTVIPYADPNYAKQRGALAIDESSAHRLDSHFALNPAMPMIAEMFRAKQATFIHAVASSYRDRSHFDGQNVLESGGERAYALKDGWLNRLIGLLPQGGLEPIAFAPTVPLALRGSAQVTSYAPSKMPEATQDLLNQVSRLYANDAQLHPIWESAIQAQTIASNDGPEQATRDLGRIAARFLKRSDGPRIAMIETGDWDTHAAQNPRLTVRLKALDTIIATMRDELGSTWQNTVILVATEFGRTVAVNGNKGTDHGTASTAMLFGGAVKGGRVLADWPGLAQTSLLDARDLRPTASLEAVIISIVSQCFGLDPERAARTLYPTRTGLRSIDGLIVA